MAIQILIISDDRVGVEPLINSLAAREARSSVQPVDPFLLPMIRETRPAAIVVDVSGANGPDARDLAAKIKDDGAFDGVPLFGVGGDLDSAVNSYDSFDDPDGIVAEVLAIADLHIGFDTGSPDGGLVADDFADIDELLSPSRTGSRTVVKKAPRRATGAPPPPPPPPPPPADGEGRSAAAREALALREELNKKDHEVLKLKDEVVERDRVLIEKDEEIERLTDRLAAVEDQLSGFEDEVENRQAELDRLAQLYDEAQAEVKSEREAREAAEQTVAEIKEEFAQRSAEIEELLEAQETQASASSDASAQLDAATKLIMAMRSDLRAYVAAAHRSAERDEERVATINSLQDALKKALGACEEAAVDREVELPPTTWEAHLEAWQDVAGPLEPEDDEGSEDDNEDAEGED